MEIALLIVHGGLVVMVGGSIATPNFLIVARDMGRSRTIVRCPVIIATVGIRQFCCILC